MTREETVEKLASGFLSALLGTNAKKIGKDVKDLSENIAKRKARMQSFTTAKNVKFKAGPFKFNSNKTVQKFPDSAINKKLEPDIAKLKSLKNDLKTQQGKTGRARLKALLGAGAIAGAAYGGNKLMTGKSNPSSAGMTNDMMEFNASESTDTFE
jgi:hypothetical protein